MLRKPASHDTSRMKDIVSSSTGSFLLLLFGNGNFEVWNTESEGFIYSCNELGVVGTSWVPKSLFFSVQTTIGTSELLAVMFADGTVSLWSVCKYRVVPNRDVLPLLPGSPVTSLISSMAGEVLVFAHGKGLLSLVSIESSGLCSTPLKNVPDESHVVGLAVSAVEEMRMSTAATRVDEKAPKICSDAFIAVVFGDGSFGVWNASNQERVSYTKASSVNIKAHALVWMAGALIVLTTHGDILVVDRLLSLVNSTVFDKALRRPLQNSAFFQPDHRIHIQAALELQLANTSMPFNEQDSDVPPSSISQLIHHGRYPCRGPFGQVLHSGILTLEQEMELYRHTMIPRYISDGIRQATTQNRWDELAIWVARFFHQEERQRLWYQFCLNKGLWSSALGSFGSPHLPSCERRKGWREVDPPVCYMYGDQFAEALASSEVVCKNHMHFNERRMEALDASKSKNVDDSRCRLSVARDLLKLQEPHRAIDVLMDVNNDVKCFPHMVDFAVAVASSVSTPNASPPALLASTARRAAALLLARGDLDGAVDKYMLSGHYYEAALTLQSNMRWGEAATLMRTAPLTSEQQRDLFYRWCAHIAKRGEHVEAARLLISMGSPFQALALLHASPHFKETAGLLGMVLLGNPTPCSRELLQTPLQSLDGEENASSSVLIGDVVVNALLDYSGTLRSVGNYVATWAVMGLIALVRR
ncbi:hypothetical protein ERJ75_000710500 [Trypanosoma vivax]|nr:hypothetical protein ERJ75_000710500 [Trypanosoma vivax]